MEEALLDIAAALEGCERLDDRALTRIINRHNKRLVALGKEKAASTVGPSHLGTGNTRPLSKKRLMAYYLQVRRSDPERWEHWSFSPEMQRRIMDTLRIKPRRTASGVATVTVLTKPWTCSSACLYCPNDIRMPKSYLHREPACQRAERCCFDPYAQVARRLYTLSEMGHDTSKVELIILGGTWNDYPLPYQIWFVRELFAALNDGDAAFERAQERMSAYERAGIMHDEDALVAQTSALQARIDAGEITFNQAFGTLYNSDAWMQVAQRQTATWSELEAAQHTNENAAHRNVGLVVETRPELCTFANLSTLRRLGCTKVQMGIQSLDARVLVASHRATTPDQIAAAFEALRLFGFKTHVHAMVNLYGSTPDADIADYRTLMDDTRFRPDEVKLYPCVLIEGTGLAQRFADGTWKPYDRETLVNVLAADTCATPAWCRISRMIRDFSASDIAAGNKHVNLRQLVEGRIDAQGLPCREIRHREVALGNLEAQTLTLDVVPYETAATSERFLQWVTPEGKIAGFCRLSLPRRTAVEAHADELPVHMGEAMIREVHVYGRVAGLGGTSEGAGEEVKGDPSTRSLRSLAQDDRSTGLRASARPCVILSERSESKDPHASAQDDSGPALQLAQDDEGRTQPHVILSERSESKDPHASAQDDKGQAQHRGLGTKLVERACELAREAGYPRINVISAVGTRGYYRKLGFHDNGLYQQRDL